ncbi:MAG: hypothetical protein II784_02420 [Oscillospiraceae bacterium]|nr:hypothetical protein [Oscillospiraceae bacterium]
MRFFLFSLKRTVRSAFFICALAVLAAAICGAAALGEKVAEPRCLIMDTDNTEISRRVYEALVNDGLTPAKDKQEIYDAVRGGTADCGIVLLPGIERYAKARNMNGSALMISSPTSVFADFFAGIVSAELFMQVSPYLAEGVLDEIGIKDKMGDISRHYEAYHASGYRFEFEIETLEGVVEQESDYTAPFIQCAAAVLLFAALFFGVCDTVRSDMETFVPTLGVKRTFRNIAVPSVLSQMLCSAAAAGIGLALAVIFFRARSAAAIAVACAVYIIALTAAALLLAAIVPRGRSIKTILPFWLLASLALCPVYLDVADVVPAAAYVRAVLPPCWLFVIPERPFIWLAASLVLLPTAAWLVVVKYKKGYGYD